MTKRPTTLFLDKSVVLRHRQAVETFSGENKNFLGRENSNKKGITLRREYYIDKEQTLSI